MRAMSHPIASVNSESNSFSFTNRVLLAVVWLLIGVVVALLVVPVILLFIGTAVPTYLSATLLLADIGLILWIVRSGHTLRNFLIASLACVVIAIVAVIASQVFASTPPIKDTNGNPLPNGISVMEKVVLGGSEQWITIRGQDVNKPVLLYLGIGGPGAGGFPANVLALAPLEEHFVVVNWDQPGTGKSYNATEISTLTVERFISDAHELTQMLRQRFHEDKIYVLGLSWGTILGIKLVQQYPDLFYAYVGTGQMVNTTENDRLGYEIALDDATKRGDTAMVNRLIRNGPPPYAGHGMAMKYALYNNILFRYMDSPTLEMILLVVPHFAREYGLVDKVNFARGLLNSFPVVYPQLRDLDFTTQAATLDVPVYFLVGRNDVNAVASLVERYYNVLKAPQKELIWVEGGHGATSEQIADTLVNTVLEQTYLKAQAGIAPTHGPSDVHEIESFLDELLSSQLHTRHIAGAGVAVVSSGGLRFAKGYGYADLATGQPVLADETLMRTDSTGKLMVWTAVMQLVEQGKVDLNADINAYLDFQIPSTFPEPITVKHLMSHSAGFEDQGYLYVLDSRSIEAAGAWLAANIPERVRPPGLVSAYSNYGTALAGYVVERVSGVPFESYVEEQIFQPLGMEKSTFRQPLPEHLVQAVSRNYHYDKGEFAPVPFIFLRATAIGEGHTTVADMAQFMLAHLAKADSPILRAETLRLMHSQLFAHDPRVSGIAYGFIESTQNGQRILRHEGNNPGVSSSSLMLLPNQGVGIYVAYNSNGGFASGEEFRQAFLNHYYPMPSTPPDGTSLTPEQVEAIVGSYRSTRMFHSTFAKVVTLMGGNYADIKVSVGSDGTFTTEGIGSNPLKWVAIEPQRLRLTDGAQNNLGDLIVVSNEQNRPSMLLIGNNPYRAYEKIIWYEAVDFQLLILMICEFLFLLALIALPLLRLNRKARNSTITSAPPLAHWLLTGTCLLALLFPVGLFITLEESLMYGVTWALIGVLAMPIGAIALAGSLLILASIHWRKLAVVDRISFSSILVVMSVFGAWLHYWNLLGFRV